MINLIAIMVPALSPWRQKLVRDDTRQMIHRPHSGSAGTVEFGSTRLLAEITESS
jgi:hypothetical protein